MLRFVPFLVCKLFSRYLYHCRLKGEFKESCLPPPSPYQKRMALTHTAPPRLRSLKPEVTISIAPSSWTWILSRGHNNIIFHFFLTDTLFSLKYKLSLRLLRGGIEQQNWLWCCLNVKEGQEEGVSEQNDKWSPWRPAKWFILFNALANRIMP